MIYSLEYVFFQWGKKKIIFKRKITRSRWKGFFFFLHITKNCGQRNDKEFVIFFLSFVAKDYEILGTS